MVSYTHRNVLISSPALDCDKAIIVNSRSIVGRDSSASTTIAISTTGITIAKITSFILVCSVVTKGSRCTIASARSTTASLRLGSVVTVLRRMSSLIFTQTRILPLLIGEGLEVALVQLYISLHKAMKKMFSSKNFGDFDQIKIDKCNTVICILDTF